MMLIQNTTRNKILAQSVRVCRSLGTRLRGLLGTERPEESEACWLVPCNSVHTIGMRYPIDIYFLNKKNEVVGILKDMRPNRVSPVFWRAHSVLEFAALGQRHCEMGDKLSFEEKP